METKVPTGSAVMDALLEGGWDSNIINTVYGPAGCGKSMICLLSQIAQAKAGKKVIFIDTEANFSVERLKQLTPDYKEVMDKTVFMLPMSFDEQSKMVEELSKSFPKEAGIIIIDTISMLYRLEFAKGDLQELTRELGTQLSAFSRMARKNHVPVLATNQVYADIENNGVRMVGGDILKYASKSLVELKKLNGPRRVAAVVKHRSIPEGKSVFFQIVDKGMEEIERKE
ncbi:MAG: DNA repair and recombination protein RadB [archaeon]